MGIEVAISVCHVPGFILVGSGRGGNACSGTPRSEANRLGLMSRLLLCPEDYRHCIDISFDFCNAAVVAFFSTSCAVPFCGFLSLSIHSVYERLESFSTYELSNK